MEILNESAQKSVKKQSMSTGGKLLIGVTGGIGIGLSIVCASFVAPAFRKFCLPYVPATTEQIQNVLQFLPKNASGKLLDIGSGDGRIVVAAAQHAKGLKTDGVELNPWLVYYSRLAALRHGVGQQARFFRRDLWKYNISEYNYVVIFGVEQMMQDLEHKLIAECPHNAKIIACRFPLPQLQPARIIENGVNTVWFYDLREQRQPDGLPAARKTIYLNEMLENVGETVGSIVRIDVYTGPDVVNTRGQPYKRVSR